jgi:subfamily B ATP-binding cassette protein MsbA
MLSLRQRLSRFVPYFTAGWAGLVIAIICSVIGALTEAAFAAGMQPLIDRGFHGKLALWVPPLAIVGLMTARGLSGYVAECSLVWSAQLGIQKMRRAMFEHLLRVNPPLFSKHSASSLTNIVVYEVQAGAQQLVYSVLVLVKDTLVFLSMAAYLIYSNWRVTVIVVLMVPGVAFAIRLIAPRLRRLTLLGVRAIDELGYVVEENLHAWRVVRLHEAQQQEGARFDKRSTDVRRLMLKSVAASAALSPLTQWFAAVAVSLVVAISLQQASAGAMTVGGFVAFVTAMLNMLQPIKRLTDVATPITRGLAALERGLELLHEEPAERGGSFKPAPGERCSIRLQDVTLQYREDHPPALDRLNLSVEPGQTVALVGPSGAGKTTLVNLLPRFLEPTGGRILVAGRELHEWDIHALRHQFAMVSQDVVLFNDTVAANVALGEQVDETRVREALKSANLLEFVEGLPQGLQTPVGHNGSQLSGGQRQRLAIARAVYKDAPILILDEATSALDSESERAVQQALDRLMQGRTTLVIAHRLSTIERATRIVAMEGGRVVEQGTHAELLVHGGLYARLHSMQFRT